jgi:cobalt/nickel transport system permease protein
MLGIDKYTYSNQLRSVHPVEKIMFSLLSIVIVLITNNILTSLSLIIIMTSAIIYVAKISIRYYFKMLLLPLFFLLTSCITIALSISYGQETGKFIWKVHIGQVVLGLELKMLILSFNTFFKSLATISSLYFLSLTTPMMKIVAVMKNYNIPGIITDLILLTYRLLIMLFEIVESIRISQLSRLGYTNFKSSLFSLSKLAANVFYKAYARGRDYQIALRSRLYQGEIKVLKINSNYSLKNWIIIFCTEIVLISISIFSGGDLFGLNY